MHLGIAVTRTAALDTTWTTVQVARAALERGHTVVFLQCSDVEIDERGTLLARTTAFDRPTEPEALAEALQARTAPRRFQQLHRLDTMLLRINPLDVSLLALLLRLVDLGVEVVNHPTAALKVAHKGWLATLKDVSTPATLVTRNAGSAHLFLEDQRGPVIVKPAQGSGGQAVTLVPAGNHAALDRALLLAAGRSRHVVVQAYSAAAEQGEKRLVWMDGEILGGYLRERAEGEFRHNLKQGGTPVAATVTAADQAVMAPLSAHLIAAGVRLAGVDLIGNHVIEVNALNPGGAFHADRLHHSDVAGGIIERLAAGRADGPQGRTSCPANP